MSLIDNLRSTVSWLIKADVANPMSKLGAVSDAYRKEFLSGFDLDLVTDSYFSTCVPQPSYQCTVGTVGFHILDSDWLMEETYVSSYSEVLTGVGFRIIGRSMGATPILLDPIDGRVYDFHSGFLYDDMLRKPGPNRDWIEALATRENVAVWSDVTWVDLPSFLEFAKISTEKMHREDLFWGITNNKISFLKSYLRLGLPLDILNEEGRGPLEIARLTGNEEAVELLEEVVKRKE